MPLARSTAPAHPTPLRWLLVRTSRQFLYCHLAPRVQEKRLYAGAQKTTARCHICKPVYETAWRWIEEGWEKVSNGLEFTRMNLNFVYVAFWFGRSAKIAAWTCGEHAKFQSVDKYTIACTWDVCGRHTRSHSCMWDAWNFLTSGSMCIRRCAKWDALTCAKSAKMLFNYRIPYPPRPRHGEPRIIDSIELGPFLISKLNQLLTWLRNSSKSEIKLELHVLAQLLLGTAGWVEGDVPQSNARDETASAASTSWLPPSRVQCLNSRCCLQVVRRDLSI